MPAAYDLELPPLLAEIAEICGPMAALRLAEARGGQAVAVPKRARPGSWLVEAVGMEAAEQICERFGGVQSLVIPLGPTAGARAKAWRQIRERLAAGESINRIAADLGVHRMTVSRHKNGHSGQAGGTPGQGRLI